MRERRVLTAHSHSRAFQRPFELSSLMRGINLPRICYSGLEWLDYQYPGQVHMYVLRRSQYPSNHRNLIIKPKRNKVGLQCIIYESVGLHTRILLVKHSGELSPSSRIYIIRCYWCWKNLNVLGTKELERSTQELSGQLEQAWSSYGPREVLTLEMMPLFRAKKKCTFIQRQ